MYNHLYFQSLDISIQDFLINFTFIEFIILYLKAKYYNFQFIVIPEFIL